VGPSKWLREVLSAGNLALPKIHDSTKQTEKNKRYIVYGSCPAFNKAKGKE